jgi:isoleucyl-tRNA synthetase
MARKNQPKRHDFLEGEFNLPKLEEKVLKFWDERHIFEKSLQGNQGKKPFVFYEGPPYANGKPGIHHVLARVAKDVILRYKTMRGYQVPRRAGWDTHGLPVEMAAEKALGFKSKKDIEKYGVQRFNEKAKEQVWIHKDEWEQLTRRIGYWLDLKNAYVTYAPEYMETIWWTLAEIWKRKLLYKGFRVVQWCTRCGTSLSSHELAQGYQEDTDTSVYVKFKLKPGQQIGNFTTNDKTYVLSWTTTPWTLPGNVALAVGKNISYAAFHAAAKGEKELYIMASDLVKSIFKDQPVEMVRADFKGRDLVGLEYEPLFKIAPLVSPASYRVYPADFVTTTDGTGVVHTAVMYGEDDYQLGKKVGLPEHHTVDEEGKFTKDVPGLAGDYVKAKETEGKIFRHLEKNGTLLRAEPYTHEYPHCWRCGTPVLYYARTSWFIGMSKLRAELLKRNKTINWFPAHVKTGRFGEWLREAKDWNLSRERYWGVPLPVWECKGCGHTEVVGSMDELSRLTGGAANNYWVMRHGEAESNMFDIIDSGQRKFLHLTPRGKKQVEASIKRFKHELDKRHEKIDFIITSDITRAKETGAINASILVGEKTAMDACLEEIHLGPLLTGYHDKKYQEYYPTYESKFEKRPPGGESLRDLRARMWDFLKECESKYKGKNILLVTHEYPTWMLFHAAEGWSEKRAIAEKEKRGGDFIGFAEIKKLNVKMVPRNDAGEVDLHRPFADRISLRCSKCASTMRRVPEVADVWYDSGAMPYAQVHYPFEHKNDLPYPADYIAEGMDQTRGWFYTLLAIATALGRPAPYKNVITFGLVNDKFGQKMSKSKGNIVEPFAVIDKYGVDAVRWYFFSGTPFGEPKNFDEQEVAKAFRKVHLIVYNSFVFWKTYAAATGKSTALKPSKNILDTWILARLNAAIDSVTKKLDHYEIREAALEIETFVDDLSRWYIRRSRRRLQRPESTKDYAAASATLHYALLSLVKLMAPFTPFFSEVLYATLGGAAESVHLDQWPAAGKKAIDKKLFDGMAAVREFAALGLAKRAEAGVKVRQPLASLTIGTRLDKDMQKILADEVNVKQILFDAKLKKDVRLDTAITVELHEEGTLREVARMVQELRQKAGLHPKDKIVLLIHLPAAAKDAVSNNEAALRSDVGATLIEYGKSQKFNAEEATKIDGEDAWIGIRKA